MSCKALAITSEDGLTDENKVWKQDWKAPSNYCLSVIHPPFPSSITLILFRRLLVVAREWNHLVFRSLHFSQFSWDLCFQYISSSSKTLSNWFSINLIASKSQGGGLLYSSWRLACNRWMSLRIVAIVPLPHLCNLLLQLVRQYSRRGVPDDPTFQLPSPSMMCLHSGCWAHTSSNRKTFGPLLWGRHIKNYGTVVRACRFQVSNRQIRK